MIGLMFCGTLLFIVLASGKWPSEGLLFRGLRAALQNIGPGLIHAANALASHGQNSRFVVYETVSLLK